MIGSLRLRLLLGTSLASAIILGLLGAAIYFSMWQSLLREFDSALLTKANALSAMAEQDRNKVRFESDYLQIPEFTRSEKPEYFEALTSDGKLLAASPSMHNFTLDRSSLLNPGHPVYRDTRLPDGRRGRMIAIAFNPRLAEDEDGRHPVIIKPTLRLLLARDTHPIRETLEELRVLLICLCGGAIVVSGIILYMIVGRAMLPVRSVASQIEKLNETDLGSRLATAGAPTELYPVVERLNGLLGRLQQAFAREKSFTADVAHELRTPLSGLQTTLQVCQSKPRELAEYVATIGKCLKMTGDMRGVIESLLLLARADSGQLPVESRLLDLCGLIRECWGQFQTRAAEKQLKVQINLPERCEIENDTGKLRIILNNLLDNAVSYSDAAGTIQLKMNSGHGNHVVEISNTGSQLRPEEAGKVFDRFWRADAARSQTGLHCGLGLSLCSRLVVLLGGSISAESKEGVFRVRWTLPSKFAGAVLSHSQMQ